MVGSLGRCYAGAHGEEGGGVETHLVVLCWGSKGQRKEKVRERKGGQLTSLLYLVG